MSEPSLDMVAYADLLVGLGERVSLSSEQMACGTGADPKVVVGWLAGKAAPSGIHAQRAVEMFSFVSEMALSVSAPPSLVGGTGRTRCAGDR